MKNSRILGMLGISLEPDAAETPLLTVAGTLERLSGDTELLTDLFHLFASSAEKNVGEIGMFLAHKDLAQAARAAHALKGSASTVGAVPLQQAAMALEQAIRNRETDRLALLHTELKDVCGRTLAAIREYQAGLSLGSG